MRIILGLAGEGYGHATRCKPVIEHLKKHDVKIMCGGKSFDYFSKDYEVDKISCLRIIYYNNAVSNFLTSVLNVVKAPVYLYSFFKTIHTFLKFKPDLVLNDFEIFTNWAAMLFRTPVINIDNEGTINKCDVRVPKKYYLSYLKTYLIVALMNPKNTFGILPSFVKFNCKDENVVVFPPLRKEIKKLKTTSEDHILVYQTSKSYKKMFEILKHVDKKFIIYGFDKDEVKDNLVFKTFSEKEFFQDLASCSGVITNGGFSLMSEALFLKKPVLSCPVRKQIEQELNSHYLEKTGCGMSVKELTVEDINRFLENLMKYKEGLRHLNWQDNFFEELDKIMASLP